MIHPAFRLRSLHYAIVEFRYFRDHGYVYTNKILQQPEIISYLRLNIKTRKAASSKTFKYGQLASLAEDDNFVIENT